MATVNVVNTRRTPYIIDGEGHLLAGGERGTVDDTTQLVETDESGRETTRTVPNDRVVQGIERGILRKVETTGAAPAQPAQAGQSAPADEETES